MNGENMRGHAQEQPEDLRLRLHRHGVPALDVAGFVTDHAGQLVIRLHEIEQSGLHVHVPAERRERVDLVVVDDLDVVRNIFTSRLGPELIRNASAPTD